MYTIDHTKKPQQISMFLAKPNRTIVGKINVAQNLTQTIRFGQVNELTFSIPYEVTINSKLVRNPIVDLIREKYLIKVVFGTLEEWYIINKKSKSMNEFDSISLECFSLAYDLRYKKMIGYKVDSYNCFQVLTDCLKDTNWKIGYVNPEFYTKYRQFDVSSKTKLDFIEEICETFKGIATYDTVNRTVSIWKEEEISTYKGFWISYGKYLETIEDTVTADEIVTRLIVTPNDNATIVSANPTGQTYIDDFSYFLYPFERDENRKVVKSSYFMTDELSHAILDYNQLINKNADSFANLLKNRKILDGQLTTLNNEMQTLKDDLQVILDDIAVAKKAKESTSDLVIKRDSKQKEINEKQVDIDSKQDIINENVAKINNLNELLKVENNFPNGLSEELNDYIQVEEWSDDNQINDNDYFYAASDYLSTVSIPPINLTLSIVNFFEIVEEQHNWSRMSIGDIIKVKHPKLGINVKTKITEIAFNYEDGTIRLTISNTKRPENIQQKFKNAFYKMDKLNTDYNKRKTNWETVATNFNDRNDRIKAKPTLPTAKSVTHKQNDDGSVDLTLSWTYPTYDKTKLDADNIDGFIIFLYASSDNETYVFGSNLADETTLSISSDKRTYTFPSVPSNSYYSLAIKAYRSVDDDINKEGILFSNICIYPIYQPNPNVTINGNVNGRVNGVMHSVSPVEPVFAEEDDVWINPTSKQSQIYTGNTWEVINAGDSTTLNGKTSDDFILATEKGVSVATTDQLNTVSSSIKKMTSGSYIGDGTLSKIIDIGFKPKSVKVYTTKSDDESIYINTETGGFLYQINVTKIYLKGVGTNSATPSPMYGKIITNGFCSGNTSDYYLNKLNVTYYWEAFE